jgi:hypothetical protein
MEHRFFKFLFMVLSVTTIVSCTSQGKKNKGNEKEKLAGFDKGMYGYDKAFLQKHGIETIELMDDNTEAGILLSPGYQGRVMTTTGSGDQGFSFGWINYRLIESGEVNNQFNPVGGEERFWIGPEGGPYSVYFRQGKEQVYANWKVPPVIDTEPFEVIEKTSRSVTFVKNAKLENASGTLFDLNIQRTVTLLSRDSLASLLNVDFPDGTSDVVGYETENRITNTGEDAWTRETGLLSIWLLCMFNPSPTTTVFIPFRPGGEGPIVNDEYFGKVPPERLMVEDSTIFFKIDGKYRSKIGLPPSRVKELCGSYDSAKGILTLVWGSFPDSPRDYVNSKWGEQDDPYNGDAINSYNDGPVEDGSIMGPFYEIETSSPAADLQPGMTITHVQRVVHIQGNEAEIDRLVKTLFNLSLQTITGKFRNL